MPLFVSSLSSTPLWSPALPDVSGMNVPTVPSTDDSDDESPTSPLICDLPVEVIYRISAPVTSAYKLDTPVTFGGHTRITAEFTIHEYTYQGRIIDFANGAGADNVIVSQHRKTGRLVVAVFRDSTRSAFTSSQVMQLGTQYRLQVIIAADLYNPTYATTTVIMNDVRWGCERTYTPRLVTRSSNYVGESNWQPDDEKFHGFINELSVAFCSA